MEKKNTVRLLATRDLKNTEQIYEVCVIALGPRTGVEAGK